MSIWKVRTSPYHTQTSGQVEWAHKMFMCMIGKLSRDQKADWPKHLPELIHVYNSKRLAITRYSPHYLMFRHQPCLPINLYFPMMRGMEKHQCVDCYIAKLCEWLWEAFREAQVQSMSEDERQKWYYDRRANDCLAPSGTCDWDVSFCPWDFFFLEPFIFHMFFVTFCLAPWMRIKDALCGQASEHQAYVTHDHYPIVYLQRWMAIVLVFPPSLRHQGQNDFNPTLAETLGHLKVSPKCNPCKLTMAQVMPCSYSQ